MKDEQEAAPDFRGGLDRNQLGALGEDIAAKYLARHSYKIIERNVRIARGELDILAWDGDTFASIEVKTRVSGEAFRPSDSVSWGKARQIRRLTSAYLQRKKIGPCLVRFDVVEVIFDPETHSATEVKLLKRFFD